MSSRYGGRQANFAALKRGRHLYPAGRPSRWALAHISSSPMNFHSSWLVFLSVFITVALAFVMFGHDWCVSWQEYCWIMYMCRSCNWYAVTSYPSWLWIRSRLNRSPVCLCVCLTVIAAFTVMPSCQVAIKNYPGSHCPHPPSPLIVTRAV